MGLLVSPPCVAAAPPLRPATTAPWPTARARARGRERDRGGQRGGANPARGGTPPPSRGRAAASPPLPSATPPCPHRRRPWWSSVSSADIRSVSTSVAPTFCSAPVDLACRCCRTRAARRIWRAPPSVPPPPPQTPPPRPPAPPLPLIFSPTRGGGCGGVCGWSVPLGRRVASRSPFVARVCRVSLFLIVAGSSAGGGESGRGVCAFFFL